MHLAALAFTLAIFHLSYAGRFDCESSSSITDEIRRHILKFHNDARRNLAQGKEPNKGGKMLNPAANMNKLRWNCEMEKQAEKSVAECNAVEGKIGAFGANNAVFNGEAASTPVLKAFRMAMQRWWAGAQNTGVPDTNEYNGCGLFSFSQMANARAAEIGCSVKNCGTKMQVLCLYDQMGHMRGEPIWETGKPCSECVGHATCQDDLCLKPKEVPDDMKNEMCPYNTGMTDKIRRRILDVHNELRSRTASGFTRNGTDPNSYAPPARIMYKLKYDCYLEEAAMTHAKKCITSHSHSWTRRGIGENIFAMSVWGADRAKAGEKAALDWYYEVKRFGVFSENRFTDQLNNRKNMVVGHYTQVVWGLTQYIGCGVINTCSDRTVVVCQYSPAGNIKNQLIYETGTPCERCPTKNCPKEENLCIFTDPFY